MEQALDLAKKGLGYTNPNPMVGAVIVRDGVVIGSGYHKRYGEAHAEINALSCADPAGATLYVTLEPCSHFGKTPPCVDAVIESKIAQVVIGSKDPNPLVHSGGGIEKLKKAGIIVIENILEEECTELNKVFFHYMQTNTPFVTMKYAMTIDGKITTTTGESKYITSAQALEMVHKSRHANSAIMVGINTVITDNPLLTCRIDGLKNPIRIICDTHLKMPHSSQIVTTANQVRTIIATACTDQKKIEPLEHAGIEILQTPIKNGRLDMQELMKKLAAQSIDSILLEGGATLNWSALQCGVVNKIQAYIAPKIFGGATALSPIGGAGVNLPAEAFQLKNMQITHLGKDILIEGEI